MDAYTGFALVYDRFMNNVPYDEWEERLCRLLGEQGITEGLVLELGCGTGALTGRMAERGFDMIGLDSSEDMLAEALEKSAEAGQSILYLHQDMRSFELYGTVAAVFCLCDSLNYILETEELAQVFRLVNNYLDPGGIFLFDFTTAAEYTQPLRRHPIVETEDEVTMIWENCFDRDRALNEHRLTFFVPEEDGLYQKWEEEHVQRAYSLAEMQEALRIAGMDFVSAWDAEDEKSPRAQSRRILVMARERGKKRENETAEAGKG